MARPFGLLQKPVRSALYAGLAFFALTGAAIGPSFGPVSMAMTEVPSATLVRHGTDLVITGSVDEMFKTAAFVGPNRSLKQARRSAQPDVLALARSFAEIRIQLAARNKPADDPLLTRESRPGGADAAVEEEGPRISVASIDPSLGFAALAAIDQASGGDHPVPQMLSERLAYARETTEPTVRDNPASNYSERERWCLSTAIYFEARSESYRGQVAVAQVVLNRVKHKLYPSTICGVVFQNQHKRNACQFSFACDGIPERVTEASAWKKAEQIADEVLSGSVYLSDVANATHYHASYVYPHWAPRMKRMAKIGLHIFYRFKHG